MNCESFLHTLLPLQPLMQLTAEKLLHSATDAEDVVQDAFADFWENRHKLKHIHNLEGYAVQSVKNRCISLMRRRKETVNIANLNNLIDEDTATEVALIEERSQKLDRMMTHLPDLQRQAVQMRYIDQMSHEEIQHRLGLSSSNVYTTISRAISALKAMSHGK